MIAPARRDPAPPAIPAWRAGEANRCPGCTHNNWLVGRQSAECAVCGTVATITGPNASTRLSHPKG